MLPRSYRLLLLASLAGLAADRGLRAQGRIVDGNVSWIVGLPPSAPTQPNNSVTFVFTADSAANNGYEFWWYYRLAGDAREYAFNRANNQLAQSYVGNTAVLQWSDVDQRGLAASDTIRVYSTGPTSGVAVHAFSVTNNNSAPVQLNLFSYVDIDVCALPSNNDLVAHPTTDDQRATRPTGCATSFIDHVAIGADRYEVAVWPALRTKLLDTAANDLTGTGLPLSNSDVTSGYQWKDRTLGPGQTLTVHLALAHNVTICQGAADASTYGTAKAGANGEPRFDQVPPFLGATNHLTVVNGLAGAVPILFFGSSRANIPVPPLGTLWVNVRFALPGAAFDTLGTSDNPIPVPLDVALCGGHLDMQAVFLDPAAVGAIAHTAGLEWVLGSM